jgi:DnaJ homolog subfamily B member 4
MKIKRRIIDGGSGRTVEVEEIVDIHVTPGWKDGTKVTFAGKGDELQGRPGQSQDVQFVIKEQPHNSFKREGNDLLYTARINLRDALVGGRFEILHLNGKQVPVSFQGPISPNTTQAMRCAYNTGIFKNWSMLQSVRRIS